MINDLGDLKIGSKSTRIKPAGAISMKSDKANGVGTLSLYAGTYGTDVATTIGIYYSSDAGTTCFTLYRMRGSLGTGLKRSVKDLKRATQGSASDVERTEKDLKSS